MKFDINNAPPTKAEISTEVQRLEANKPGQLKSLRQFSFMFLLVGILTSIGCYFYFPAMLNDKYTFIFVTPFVISYHVVFLSQAFFTSNTEKYFTSHTEKYFLVSATPITVFLAIYFQPYFNFTVFEMTVISILAIYSTLGLLVVIKFYSNYHKSLRAIESLTEVDESHNLDIAKFIEVPEIKNYVDAIAAQGRKTTQGEHSMLKDQFYLLMHRKEIPNLKKN